MPFVVPASSPSPLQSPPAEFNPFNDNGGTILAVAGSNFSVIVGDVKRGDGLGRHSPKVFRLTDRAVLATTGFSADGNTFVKKVMQRLEWYRHAHARDMTLSAVAQLIQGMLFQRRFIPFYVYNILGGIEEDGTGAVYSFDPQGSFKRTACLAAGAASLLVQPYIDHQIFYKSQAATPAALSQTDLALPRVLSLVVEAFTAADARHADIGDALEVFVVLARGSSSQGLETLHGVTELTRIPGGERIFVLKRILKHA